MYEDEELSELSEEEDELATDKKNHASGRTHKDPAIVGYNLQKALKPPRATTYTAQALYDQIHSSDIDLDPEYQRDVVWTKEKQTNLIDSILRNFYIPPIIFAVKVYEDGTESKTCIDGKQRLTSIHRITGEKLWFKDEPSEGSTSASKRKILPEKYRTMFSNKQVVCVEYSDLTDGDERDIFQRVQLGMALTSAEKLHVINTPRAKFIRSLLEEFVSEETLGSPKIPWAKERGSDFRCLAQAVYLMDRWPATKTGASLKNAGSLPQVEKWLSLGVDQKRKATADDDDDYGAAARVPESFIKKVKESFSLMVQLAASKSLSGPFTSYPKVSPIEMICFSLLVYVHGVLPSAGSRMSLSELSQAIEEMRRDVRVQHKDIRMNDRVGKTMIEFIQTTGPEKNSKPKKGAKDNGEFISAPVPTTKSRGKRRRVSEADVESDDEDYQPHKRSSRKSRAQVGVRSKPKADGASRVDHLATARAAKSAARASRAAQRASSPPNPQRLPSPDPASDALIKAEPEGSGSQTPMPPAYQMAPPDLKQLEQLVNGLGLSYLLTGVPLEQRSPLEVTQIVHQVTMRLQPGIQAMSDMQGMQGVVPGHGGMQ
ncbi:hypothetical protein BDP27DRAFT_1252376 [Rhodocollybia butyracea]|uniref:GmrSD restriction endonucleases N-terminal domain-containing protein n=1 Tax=Rhodocollybia butyracea TaxID=206335 RepID=A0A9P5UH53_9AGAR|nr:hypothetical protein BDP27DRAFT_1252376 [Rhodocollybia butyracea]